MKKSVSFLVLYLLFASILSLPTIAQDTDKNEFNTKKTEVNIAVANIFAKNYLYYPYTFVDDNGYFLTPYIYDYYPQRELVIGFKYHTKNGAFRLGTNFWYNTMTYEADNTSPPKHTQNSSGLSLNLGYEWHSTFNRVNIFYGFDVSSSYTSYYLELDYDPNESQWDMSESRRSEYSYGVNPLLGVNIFITPNLSIGTEVKFIAEYVSGKTKSKSIYSNPQSNPEKISERSSSGFRTRFGPVGFLSINIHF